MNFRNLFIFIAISVIACASCFAVDFGGKLNSGHSLMIKDYSNLSFNESDKVNLWLAATLHHKSALRLNTDVSYEFKYDTESKEMFHILDVNVLKLSMQYVVGGSHTISLSAGRFGLGDTSGLVFNQICDGVFFDYKNRVVDISAYVGITGLLNTHDVKMILPQDTTFVAEDNKFYKLGVSYMPVGLSLKFPELFAGQTLVFDFWHFRDFSKDNYQRYYGTLQLAGQIVPKLFYSVLTTFETEKFDAFSNLTQGVLRFFPSGNSSVSGSVIYASGANGAGTKHFTGFTSFKSSSFMAEKEISSLLAFTVSASIEFASRVYMGLEVGAILGLPEKEVSYDGLLLNANVLWNILHDLKLNAGFTSYFAQIKENSKMKVSFGLIFVF